MTLALPVQACGAHVVAEAGLTDPGLARPANEDSLVRRPEIGLWAVADGMGGHDHGAWASAAIARALATVALAGDLETDVMRVAAAVQSANTDIWRHGEQLGRRIGSTVTALVVGDGRYRLIWAGDSRAYLLRAGVLERLTSDHTYVQDRLDRGLLAPEEALEHPLRHVLTRAVGAQAELELQEGQGRLEPGDVLLVCSDGVHGVVSDAEIADALQGHDPDGACSVLQRLCHDRGAPDNLTMAVVATG